MNAWKKTGRRLLVTFAVVVGVAAGATAIAGVAPEDVLKRADLVRGPDEPYTLKMNVTAYRGKELLNQTSVLVNSHDYSRSLVEFVAPPRDAGRKLLKVSENVWVRIPSSKRAIRITPQQRLLGQASNADVLSTNYSADYAASLLGEETVTTYEGKPTSCHKLELVKKTPAASYYRIIYWIEKETFRPIRSEFYAQTGKLIKAAHFMRYATALGTMRPGRVVIVNAVNKEEFTVLDIAEYGKSGLPVSEYTETALN